MMVYCFQEGYYEKSFELYIVYDNAFVRFYGAEL